MVYHFPIRILLIDAHRLFNHALKSLLNQAPGLTVCGQVFQAGDALLMIEQTRPKLIILDVNSQGASGIELGKTILTHFPDLRVIALTMYDHPNCLLEARNAGFHGYLLKDTDPVDFLRIIRTIANGQTYFDPLVAKPDQAGDGTPPAQ